MEIIACNATQSSSNEKKKCRSRYAKVLDTLVLVSTATSNFWYINSMCRTKPLQQAAYSPRRFEQQQFKKNRILQYKTPLNANITYRLCDCGH